MGYSARQNVGCAPHRGSRRHAEPRSLTLKVGRHRVPEAHLTALAPAGHPAKYVPSSFLFD